MTRGLFGESSTSSSLGFCWLCLRCSIRILPTAVPNFSQIPPHLQLDKHPAIPRQTPCSRCPSDMPSKPKFILKFAKMAGKGTADETRPLLPERANREGVAATGACIEPAAARASCASQSTLRESETSPPPSYKSIVTEPEARPRSIAVSVAPPSYEPLEPERRPRTPDQPFSGGLHRHDVQRIQDEIDVVNELMITVVDRTVERGDNLDQLKKSTASLANTSKMFKRQARAVETESWIQATKAKAMENLSQSAAIGAAIFLGVVLLLVLLSRMLQ
ncbi:uncharacterized protein BJ171DRAFT_517983 [Polychytrium aggregatum]|uniref:uncharacterized protein n=1 Tax=Polychytrium aggregatum TaxID=110093 RepID=UPI0022FE9B24|nr:uncharacterized protein BJ171DRAFT_517983 [Polychytrium aggregatum]KAI9199579.1 hypothetical protein BJ171DRAFT_517983 [Polychytrium aggregatum]